MDGNKHPVEHAGLVAPGRNIRFLTWLLLPLLSKVEDKTSERVQFEQKSIPNTWYIETRRRE